jgi:hypothetical protein
MGKSAQLNFTPKNVGRNSAFSGENTPNQQIFGCTPKKISSGVDNGYQDEFFEEFICGR